MRTGKISETVLKRSVLRQLPEDHADVLRGAAAGTDAALLAVNGAAALAAHSVRWNDEKDTLRAVHNVCNNLVCTGAVPAGVVVTLLLPPDVKEPQIRRIMKSIAKAADSGGLSVLGGHTEIMPCVSFPVLSLTGIGKTKESRILLPGGARPGDDLLLTKWAGLEGTACIAHTAREELLAKYPAFLVDAAEGFFDRLSVRPEAEMAVRFGVHAMHDLSGGGVFAALWEMAESSGIGLRVVLRDIPVRQETVEICDYFDLNLYELSSGGSLLLAVPDGNGLVEALQAAGIPAAVIGKAQTGRDRILTNGEEIRYLEPPKGDEENRFFEEHLGRK